MLNIRKAWLLLLAAITLSHMEGALAGQKIEGFVNQQVITAVHYRPVASTTGSALTVGLRLTLNPALVGSGAIPAQVYILLAQSITPSQQLAQQHFDAATTAAEIQLPTMQHLFGLQTTPFRHLLTEDIRSFNAALQSLPLDKRALWKEAMQNVQQYQQQHAQKTSRYPWLNVLALVDKWIPSAYATVTFDGSFDLGTISSYTSAGASAGGAVGGELAGDEGAQIGTLVGAAAGAAAGVVVEAADVVGAAICEAGEMAYEGAYNMLREVVNPRLVTTICDYEIVQDFGRLFKW